MEATSVCKGSDANVIRDISPLIDESIAVWPGDTPYQTRDTLRLSEGDSVNLSDIRLSCHTGAHADAPLHYIEGAAGIEELSLDIFIGLCTLLEVTTLDGVVRPQHLGTEDLNPRVLFRTRRRTDRTVFPTDFGYLSVELVDALADRGVVLVGLDSPSVDAFDSEDLPVHHALHRRGIANLENLQLEGVPCGRYELIALPLRLHGRDASPVRAVLRDLEGN